MFNLNTPTEIDSFKVRIPYRNVEITDAKLEGTKITYIKETQEVLEEFKNNSLKFEDHGIKTRFAIEVMPTDGKGGKKKYLTILINAKLLTNLYLQGITNYNIEIIHKHLMAYNVSKFSLQTFLNGFVTDVDFKTDVRATMHEFEELSHFFKINARLSNKIGEGFRPFDSKTNKGIQFSTRETKAFLTNPFFKMYHKEIELKYNSVPFYTKYIKGQDIKNLVRFEITIKNNKHMKVLGIESNTLSHLLNLSDTFKKSILSKTINIHLDSKIKETKTKEGMNPLDELLHNLIIMQMKQGNTFERIRDFALSTFTDKVAKSRKKNQLNKIYKDYIQGKKEDISTQNIDSILTMLGVNEDKR